MSESDSSNSLDIPKLKNRSYGLSLYQEASAINPDMAYQRLNEQRWYPRFKPGSQIFILHSIQGTVDDISIGGLSYTYHQLPGEAIQPLPGVSTIFSADKDYLFNIPCTVIKDTVLRKSYSFSPELRQRRIQFDDLSEKQVQELEQFILKHAVVPTAQQDKKKVPPGIENFDYTT